MRACSCLLCQMLVLVGLGAAIASAGDAHEDLEKQLGRMRAAMLDSLAGRKGPGWGEPAKQALVEAAVAHLRARIEENGERKGVSAAQEGAFVRSLPVLWRRLDRGEYGRLPSYGEFLRRSVEHEIDVFLRRSPPSADQRERIDREIRLVASLCRERVEALFPTAPPAVLGEVEEHVRERLSETNGCVFNAIVQYERPLGEQRFEQACQALVSAFTKRYGPGTPRGETMAKLMAAAKAGRVRWVSPTSGVVTVTSEKGATSSSTVGTKVLLHIVGPVLRREIAAAHPPPEQLPRSPELRRAMEAFETAMEKEFQRQRTAQVQKTTEMRDRTRD